MASETLEMNKTRQNGTTRFEIRGRLNAITESLFQKTVMEALDESATTVELDCAGLTYLASAGLRVMVMASKTAAAKTKKLLLTHVPKNIMEVLRISGFATFLNIQ